MPQLNQPESRVAALQQVIRDRLDDLREVPPDSREYGAAARRVLDATEALLAYEEQLPVLVDEEPRVRSAAIVRWSGVAAAAVAVLLALAMIPGWVTVPWAVLLVPLAVAGVRTALLPVHPAGGPHVRQRQGAVLLVAGLPFAVPACLDWLPAWTAVATFVLTAAGLARLLADPVRPSGPDDAATPPTGLPEVSP